MRRISFLLVLFLAMVVPAHGQSQAPLQMQCGQVSHGLAQSDWEWHAECATSAISGDFNQNDVRWAVIKDGETLADGRGFSFSFPLGKAWRMIRLALWRGKEIIVNAYARWNERNDKAEFWNPERMGGPPPDFANPAEPAASALSPPAALTAAPQPEVSPEIDIAVAGPQ